MAGDWIKMRVDLWDDPRVVRIATQLRANRATVIGALFRLWCLGDQYTEDGSLVGYTPDVLDDALSINGFSAAISAVGWLQVNGDAIAIPKFREHNGQSAKRRTMERERKRRVRKVSASDADKKRTREEKRREELEKNREDPGPPEGGEGTPQDSRCTPIPADLDHPPFPAAWSDWLAYRRERRLSSRDRTIGAQLHALAPLGPIAAAECVLLSIRNGWNGVFPERMNRENCPGDRGGNRQSGQVPRPKETRPGTL